jgi:primosomal protein N' (replication factor Y)
LGTQKVQKEVENFFSGARIAVIDSQMIRAKNFQEKIYREFSDGQIDILIGTQMISKGWDLPRVSLVGIIDTDNMLTMPDFSTGERAYQHIVQVSGRVARPGAKYPGSVVIQSYQPENKILKLAAEKNYSGFYLSEEEERRPFHYPPFGRLVKLVCQDFSLSKAKNSAIDAYGSLKNIDGISVTEPQEAYVSKIRGRYRIQIVIKLADEMPGELVKVLKSLPGGWIVDVDPISLI